MQVIESKEEQKNVSNLKIIHFKVLKSAINWEVQENLVIWSLNTGFLVELVEVPVSSITTFPQLVRLISRLDEYWKSIHLCIF